MRVVLICDWFLKYAAMQAAGHARAGAEVTLVCREHAEEFGGDDRERMVLLQRARDDGVRVLELPGRVWDPRGLIAVRRELRTFRPDVVHVHDLADPRAFAILPSALRVLTVHDPAPHPGQDAHGKALSRALLNYPYAAWRRWAKLVVLHSEALVARYRPHRGQSVAIVAHGIDVAPEPLPPPSTPAVGFFGRFEPYKGLEVLADAMKRVWTARPEVRLLIAGTGSSEWQLADARIDRVPGYLPEGEVDRFLERMTVMALPYTEASQSGAGSVAVGRGIPLVASRIGGLPDLVLDESYLAEPGDDAGLAAVLLCHLEDGIAVRRRVFSEVAAPRDWEAVGRLTLDAYADALRAS